MIPILLKIIEALENSNLTDKFLWNKLRRKARKVYKLINYQLWFTLGCLFRNLAHNLFFEPSTPTFPAAIGSHLNIPPSNVFPLDWIEGSPRRAAFNKRVYSLLSTLCITSDMPTVINKQIIIYALCIWTIYCCTWCLDVIQFPR